VRACVCVCVCECVCVCVRVHARVRALYLKVSEAKRWGTGKEKGGHQEETFVLFTKVVQEHLEKNGVESARQSQQIGRPQGPSRVKPSPQAPLSAQLFPFPHNFFFKKP
jgi:hypothetical protein